MKKFDYDMIYQQYYPLVYYLCMRYLDFNEADARDIAQNVFFLLFQKEEKITDEAKVRA